MNRVSKAAVAAALCYSLYAKATEVRSTPPAPVTPSADACAQYFQSPADLLAQKKLLTGLRATTKMGADRHNPLPHLKVSFARLQKLFATLSNDDIPTLVRIVNEAVATGAVRIAALNLLTMYGQAALPCLAAAQEVPAAKGANDVRSVVVNINAASAPIERPAKK